MPDNEHWGVAAVAPVVSKALGGNIPWEDILPGLFSMIRECLDRTSPEAVSKELATPGLRVTARLRREFRKQGYHGRGLRHLVRDAMEELRSSSEQDIRDLMTEATDDTEMME